MTTKTKTISALKTFAIQQFHYEKIGLEDTFPSTVPDIDCIKQLHERIDAMAREVYPWYFKDNGISYPLAEQTTIINKAPNPDWGNGYKFSDEYPQQPEEQKPLMQLIQESKTVTELKGWNLLIKNEKDQEMKRELLLAYDAKMNELKKSETPTID